MIFDRLGVHFINFQSLGSLGGGLDLIAVGGVAKSQDRPLSFGQVAIQLPVRLQAVGQIDNFVQRNLLRLGDDLFRVVGHLRLRPHAGGLGMDFVQARRLEVEFIELHRDAWSRRHELDFHKFRRPGRHAFDEFLPVRHKFASPAVHRA